MTAHENFHQATRENVESEHSKSNEASVAGRPIVAKEDNAIQQRQQLLSAMTTFRFTKDGGNSFTLCDSGKEVLDKRPDSGERELQAEVQTDAQKAPQTEAQKEAQACKQIKEALTFVDGASGTREALKNLTPEQVKHVMHELAQEHVNTQGLNMNVDKATGKVTVKFGSIYGFGGEEVYAKTPQTPQKETAAAPAIERPVAEPHNDTRTLIPTTMWFGSLESSGHKVGDTVITTDKQGHDHIAKVGKVANGHITEMLDSEKQPPAAMSLEDYKKKHHVNDQATFTRLTEPDELNPRPRQHMQSKIAEIN